MEAGGSRGFSLMGALPLMAFAVASYFITSTVASSMNVAAGALEGAYGWDAVFITSSISIASVFNVVLGYIAGRACSRFSPKMVCFAWGVLYIAGVAGMCVSKEFSIFVLTMIVANAAASAWGYNTVPVLITNWFPTRKGAVQGLVSMGIPLGAGLASIVYSWGLDTWGIDAAFLPFIIIAGVALLLLGLFISDMPESRGMLPDTLVPCARRRMKSASLSTSDARREPATTYLKDIKFVALSAVLGIQLLYSGGLMVQIVPRLLELGYSVDEATVAMLVSAGFACVGSIVCGAIGDRFGYRVGVVISFVVGIVAIVLNLVGGTACVLASLALIGVVTGSADNWPVSICAERYGREGFNGAFGVMLPIIQLVGALGPAFFALIAGSAGSYAISYTAGAVLMAVGLVLFLLMSASFSRKGAC